MKNEINIGEKLFNTGKLKDAENYFLNLNNDNPKKPEILNNIGAIYFRQNKIEKSLEYICKALQLNPYYRNALVNLSIVLKNASKNFDTKSIVEQYLKKFPFDKKIKKYLNKNGIKNKGSNEFNSEYITKTEIPLLLQNANPQDPIKDITLIIPSYNRVALLASDIIHRYKFGKQPAVVVDDCSDEDQKRTLDILSKKNHHLNFIYHDKNQGVAQTLRTGVEHIRTPYLQFLDDDDILLCKDKNKLTKTIFKCNEKCLIVPRYIFNLYPDGTIQQGYDRSKFENLSSERILSYLCKTGEMHALRAGGIFSVEHVKKALPESIFTVSEDFLMLVRIVGNRYINKIVISDDFYYLRRIQDNTLSKRITTEKIILHLLSILVAAYYCFRQNVMIKSIFVSHFKKRLDLLHRIYFFKKEIDYNFLRFIDNGISRDEFISGINKYIPSLSFENVPPEIFYLLL
jgi:tetratricopeptide (TPR) repeat protein